MAELGRKTLRAWLRLHHADKLITRALEEALAAAGLPRLIWRDALVELERREAAGMRPYELQAALEEDQPAISRLLDRLVAAGCVERAPCDDDRRGWRVSITDKGRETLSKMNEIHAGAVAAHFADRISEKQAKTLDEILGDLLHPHR